MKNKLKRFLKLFFLNNFVGLIGKMLVYASQKRESRKYRKKYRINKTFRFELLVKFHGEGDIIIGKKVILAIFHTFNL